MPCPALQFYPIVALRPRSGQRLPADPVRLQAFSLQCSPLLYAPGLSSALPSAHAVTRWIAPPIWATKFAAHARKQAVRCADLQCTALPFNALHSARAVNLCSHFFRLACFKLCQIVASELGAVVAKSFKHGRMHKRILHIGHVQNFGDDGH